MNVEYPVEKTVSVWLGTFKTEEDFARCIDESVVPALALDTDIADFCEVGFESEPLSVEELLEGFSGSETFMERAIAEANARGVERANCALVCYYLACGDAPENWGGLKFLGSIPGQDVVGNDLGL
jgi:hypothetical protein